MWTTGSTVKRFQRLQKVQTGSTLIGPSFALHGTHPHKLANNLCKRLKTLIVGYEHSINNDQQIFENLGETDLEEDGIMISDTISLITAELSS